MDINTQDLRATLAALPTSGRGRRYTPELRDQAVTAVRSGEHSVVHLGERRKLSTSLGRKLPTYLPT